ncbi:hypothetical protein B0I32_101475 [Nonomuraea fuscirosea]|uniref:Uncharacterized protein n=1 Tax=Nonomuraea fuscirosea TaxID=1291556 RepID=A0A2T0NBM5_9ACTN|nr:hypothetical protein [Nonomuraea fuscirosea]PRX70387.1 hypothetical protein B0I32_101475 [Nonomuraea fuscirosea]
MSPMVGIDPALMTRLIDGMKRVSGMIPDVDRQVERALTSLGIHLWGPSPLRDIGRQMSDLIPSLQGRLDLILAEPDRTSGTGGTLWADESPWLSSSPAEGAASAKTLATQLRDQVASHSLDPHLVAEIERHKNDPYFAMAFATEIPPRELKALINALYGAGLSASARPLQRDVITQDRLLTMLSTILGTASRGAGRLRLPDGYADQLVDGIENRQDAFAVKRLLQDAEFDHTFLLTVVQKLYDKDLAHPPDPSLPRDPWALPGPRDAAPGDLSPMGAALTALAHHPTVAQDFFTDPQRRPLAYLMRRHPWDGDADTELGWAIEAAGTEFRDHDLPPGGSRGYKSALIASWAVHFWSDPKVQQNLPNTRGHLGTILAQYTGDLHRDIRAFTERLPGVMTARDADKNLIGAEPYGAKFNAADLKQGMTWAFEDEETFKTAAVAHALYSTEMMDELGAKIANEVAISFAAWKKAHPEATEHQASATRQKLLEARMSGGAGGEFAQAARNLSMTTWVITDAANIADIDSAKQGDTRFAIFKEITEKVAGLAPCPQGKFFGLLIDEAKRKIFGEIKSNNERRARADADTALGTAKHMFTDLTIAAMMRHGLFGDASTPAKTHPYHYEDFRTDSDGHFLRNGELVSWTDMNTSQQDSYEEWLGVNAIGRVFSEPSESIAIGFKDAEKYYSGHGS